MRVANKWTRQEEEVLEDREAPIPHVGYQVQASLGSLDRPLTLDQLIESETGSEMMAEIWVASQKRGERIEAGTDRMQALLEAGGIEVERDRSLTYVGAVTGLTKEVRSRRNINLLLSCAQMNRRQQQLSLAHFMADRPYTRYMVVSSGQRIPAFSDLRQTMTEFGRRISKWAYKIRHRFGIEVYARVFELPRDPEDQGSYNLHANILYDPPLLSKEEWKAFLALTHEHFGTVLKDAGKIRDLKEIVKYCFKPEDLNGMTSDEAVWFHENMFRKRIFVAFGQFARFRRELKDRKLKLIMLRGAPVAMKKMTAYRQTKSEREAAARAEAEAAGVEYQETTTDPEDVENMLLTVVQPCTMLSPYKEPVFLIQGYNPGPLCEKKGRSRARYIDILLRRSEALDAWEARTSVDPSTIPAYVQALRSGATNVLPMGRKKPQPYRLDTATISVPARDAYLSEKHPALPDSKPPERGKPHLRVVEDPPPVPGKLSSCPKSDLIALASDPATLQAMIDDVMHSAVRKARAEGRAFVASRDAPVQQGEPLPEFLSIFDGP